MTCHWVGPLISKWTFKLIVSIRNAMSRVDCPGPNEGGRRDREAVTLPRSV